MGIPVAEPSGNRWEGQPVALLQEGAAEVDLPGVSIVRWTAGRDPDPRINVQVFSRFSPPFVTVGSARRDVDHGRRVVREALNADERLRVAFDEFAVLRELVSGEGERDTTLRLTSIAEDGPLHWAEDMRPVRIAAAI